MRLFSIRSVVAASDLGAGSDAAVRAAAAVAARHDAGLHVVCGLGVEGLPLREAFDVLPRLRQRTAEAAAGLDAQLERCAAGCTRAGERRVAYSAPPAAVLRCARELSGDVVVLPAGLAASGSRGEPSLAGLVARRTDAACLVAGGPLPPGAPRVRLLSPGPAAADALSAARSWLAALLGIDPAVEERTLVDPALADGAGDDADLAVVAHAGDAVSDRLAAGAGARLPTLVLGAGALRRGARARPRRVTDRTLAGLNP